jgi:hypothetical protein
MEISKEQAKSDLAKVITHFGTLGPGTELDRAAQLVMQPIGVLERRLGKRDSIKMLYFEMQDSSKILPPSVYKVAEEYVNGNINETIAREKLQETQKQYEEIFKEMGLSPQISKMLFQNF